MTTSEPSIFNTMSELFLGGKAKASDEASDDDDDEMIQQIQPDHVRVFQVASTEENNSTTNDDDEMSVVQSNVLERASGQLPRTQSNSQTLSVNEQNAAEESVLLPALQSGTILEAAFVDPAYSWPPKDGEGQNAIEIRAAVTLLNDFLDDSSIRTTDTMRARMTPPTRPDTSTVTAVPAIAPPKPKWWQCCGKHADTGAVVAPEDPMVAYRAQKAAAEQARYEHAITKREKIRQKEKEYRKKNRYNRVPEGILIYRLDTSTHQLSLMSEPHTRTNTSTLIREMRVVQARPSPDRSRRGVEVVGEDGRVFTLVACEQRTATSWWEAMNLMLAKNNPKSRNQWSKEKLNTADLCSFEDQYLNLAGYSHNLIRAGALPGGRKNGGGAGGIYYSTQRVQPGAYSGGDEEDEEALEAIAKRRAIIKDSWDFYRMICSLLRDRNKYDEVFRRLQLDPVYPYLNSMTGLNDPGDAGYENHDKTVTQHKFPEYETMTSAGLARTMINKAEIALPSLVEICKALAGSLGMEEVGVGPIKDVDAALRKAEKKYNGDLLKVTDYCRALLVVKDFPSFLALLELARDSFGPLIRRVKMSSLKAAYDAKPGGYRDCIINVELKEHICEIQVHIWPLWTVCGVDGFRHYRHCLEYKTDTFDDPFDALEGLDRKTMAELVVMAEEAVANTPLDNLEWYHEKYILDYFAEAGIFLKHGLDVWAELILKHLIRLRIESPDIGPDHHETVNLYKYLAQSLKAQQKYDEANEVMIKVKAAEMLRNHEKTQASQSLWDSLMSAPQEALDFIIDPNKKEREEEEKRQKEIKASKKRWRKIRQERFSFLDMQAAASRGKNAGRLSEEKKIDVSE